MISKLKGSLTCCLNILKSVKIEISFFTRLISIFLFNNEISFIQNNEMKEEFTMNNLKKLDTFKTLNSNDLKQINGGVIMIGYKIGKYIANKLLN